MKAQKKLNLVLLILIIVLISIVSFVGVFYQNKNQMVNHIQGYILGTDLQGYRNVVLNVDSSNEGNTEELKNYDNYIKSANIIRKRLESMQIPDYSVICDETTGKIEIKLPETPQTDYVLADITQKGKFEVIDTSNDEVLMNNNDIKNTKVNITKVYGNTQNVYMDIKFNGQGTKKFKNITKNYQNVVSNEVVNNAVENQVTNENANSTANETEENNEEKAKEIALKIDGTSMMQTTFSEVIDNGILSLSLGSASSKEDLKVLNYQASSLAAILENDEMPLQYEVSGNMYVSSPIEKSHINILILIGGTIAFIIFIITIVKYKGKGLAIALSSIGFMAVNLLVIRYANVTITLEGIFAIGLTFIINYILSIMLLKNMKKDIKKTFEKELIKFSLGMIPILIFAIICCFSGWMPIFSFGMIIFWGLIVSIIYNFIITQLFIKNISK